MEHNKIIIGPIMLERISDEEFTITPLHTEKVNGRDVIVLHPQEALELNSLLANWVCKAWLP
jgi:hypothetical protein